MSILKIETILTQLKNNLFNLIIFSIFAFLLIKKIPSIIDMYMAEGSNAEEVMVSSLSGHEIKLPLKNKHILVFWATWCAPCKVELARINKMVKDKEIPADFVMAVSIGENLDLVATFANEQKYEFKVAADPSGRAAEKYKVTGTPTIFFIDADQKINWMTTGLSPSLEFRVHAFYKNQ